MGAYIPSGFNKKTFSVPKKINKEDLPRGRPLWQREVNKVVPAPTCYSVKREFDGHVVKDPSSCKFGVGHAAYIRVSTEALANLAFRLVTSTQDSRSGRMTARRSTSASWHPA